MLTLLMFVTLSNGLYRCHGGNNDSICDQRIRNVSGGISVLYDGDCAGQGPYFYACDKGACQDDTGTIVFEIKGNSSYRWENKQYEISCDFKKSE